MKHIRKIFQTVMVMALAICLTSMPVMAQEVTDYDAVQQENEAVTYASVPSGYTLVGTFSRTPQTYYLGTTPVRSIRRSRRRREVRPRICRVSIRLLVCLS